MTMRTLRYLGLLLGGLLSPGLSLAQTEATMAPALPAAASLPPVETHPPVASNQLPAFEGADPRTGRQKPNGYSGPCHRPRAAGTLESGLFARWPDAGQ